MVDFSTTWLKILGTTMMSGAEVAPRGKLTKEVLQRTILVDMRKPVLTVPNRKLSYIFMLAEAHWILSGDDRVSTIQPYNSRIANFSDDGKVFFGAYGPKIISQLPYVVDKLLIDRDSRQAGINIWRECPPPTKDVPCTVSIFFNIRNSQLMCHVFMRSSDIWLGVPYDVFNFSMLSHLVCTKFNSKVMVNSQIRPGFLHLTAASSHLYEENFEVANDCIRNPGQVYVPTDTPDLMWQDQGFLMDTLGFLKDQPPTSKDRWWLNKL